MRATDSIRVLVGAPLLMRPDLPARALGVRPIDGLVLVTRVLGARYVVQGLVSGMLTRTAWWKRTLVADSVVDGSHAASMLPVAALLPHFAAPALASASLATGLAVLDGRAARRRPSLLAVAGGAA